MRLAFALTLLLLFGTLPAFAGETAKSDLAFADPQPTINHPRRIILSLSESDPARINEVISNIGNIQKYYGAGTVEIALIAYGPGIHAVLRSDSRVKARIAGLLAIEIEVLGCGATLDSLHKTASDLLPGVKMVANGLPEIVERQVQGWIYVRP